MTEYPAISVVMPAYNAGQYIAKSIDSILSQDFRDFELIIVDDCSMDNTTDIVLSYKDSRIKLIKTDCNTGSAKLPREIAVEQACAPYICWIDSDDTVDPDYLSSLLDRKIKTGANIVCSCMFAECGSGQKYTLPDKNFDYGMIISGRDALIMTLDFPWRINLNGWLCDKWLWTAISTFKSMSINHMDADDFSAREILFNAEKVAFCTAAYHYRLHPEAITKKISPKKFESVITDRLVLEYLEQNYPPAVRFIKKSLCKRMIALMRIYVVNSGSLKLSDRLKSKKLLNQYFSKISFSEIWSAAIPLKLKILLSLPFSLSLAIVKSVN